MKISKAKLRQIIKEEIGRAIEPKDGWTTTKDPGGRKRPLRKTVPVGEEDPKKKRDYDEEDLLAMQHGNPEGSPPELREDADDDRDFEIEEATRDGEADGAAGRERTPPRSFASRYYNDAYDRAAKKSK